MWCLAVLSLGSKALSKFEGRVTPCQMQRAVAFFEKEVLVCKKGSHGNRHASRAAPSSIGLDALDSDRSLQ